MATDPLILAQENVEFGGKPGIMDDFSYNNNVMQATANIRMGRYIHVFSHFHIFSSGKSVRAHKIFQSNRFHLMTEKTVAMLTLQYLLQFYSSQFI